MKELFIKDISNITGISSRTIRYYESIGFLSKAKRNKSNYRVYSEEDIKIINFIKKSKLLGFSLEEIRTLLNIKEKGNSPCNKVIELIENHIIEIDKRIIKMINFKNKLQETLNNFKSNYEVGSSGHICGLIEKLIDENN